MLVPCRYRTAVVPLRRLSRGALVMTLQPMLLKTFWPSTTGRADRAMRAGGGAPVAVSVEPKFLLRARDEITESKEKNPAAGRNAGKESGVYA